MPRKTDAPPHPFLTPKERARKADSQEPATYSKSAKWKQMPPNYIEQVGWPLPWPESSSASSRPGSSWDVYGSPAASTQWVTRKPANINFDGEYFNRFSKERKRRQIRCDACQKDCKGNDKGDFVDPQCQVERENQEKLWKQGHLDATWFCVSCLKDSKRSVDKTRDTASLFKQRQDNKSAFMARSSP